MNKATQKQYNSQRILREIYHQGQASRADLARITKLTRPTVSNLVGDLIERELVAEVGVGASTGGKRPVLLSVPSDAYHLLCVDIGNQAYRGAVVDLRGNMVARYSLPATNVRGDAAIALIYQLIDRLRTLTNRPILGIGIGTPGLIDPHLGIVRRAINLDWTDLPLRQLLTERYGKPIYIANDSDLAALAEFMLGESQESRNVILIKMGQGISAGIVWNGSILEGDGFGAGEIGQVVMVERDGRRLTLEQLVGTHAVMQLAQSLISAEITWQELFTSSETAPIIEQVGRYIGIAVANLIATLNIHQVILSGRLTQFGDPLLTAIRKTARHYALTTMVDDTEIRFSTLGTEIVLLGCAALLLKHELGVL